MRGQVVLTIEDDDGFKTQWPWPEQRLMLANADFVSLCEAQHDALKQRQREKNQ